jgi:hypothetical protein
MFVLLFRGFFLMGIISWYSMNVWNFIDGYFRNEYKRYLDEEMKRHPQLKPDVTTTNPLPPTENEIIEFKSVHEIEEQSCNQQEQDSCQNRHKKSRIDFYNDQQDDEEVFIRYWSTRGKENVDNSDNNNLYCSNNAVEEVNCVDN